MRWFARDAFVVGASTMAADANTAGRFAVAPQAAQGHGVLDTTDTQLECAADRQDGHGKLSPCNKTLTRVRHLRCRRQCPSVMSRQSQRLLQLLNRCGRMEGALLAAIAAIRGVPRYAYCCLVDISLYAGDA